MAAIRFIRTTARRLLRAREGIAALEFAFALPVVLAAIMGVIEISMMLFVSSLLEGGLRDVARFGITGPNAVPVGTIRNMVNDRLMGLVVVQPADVKIRVYDCLSSIGPPENLILDANGNGKWDPGDTYEDKNLNGRWDSNVPAPDTGGSGQVVVYDLAVEWHLLTPFLAPFFNGGVIPLTASIAVRNEPWNANNAQASAC